MDKIGAFFVTVAFCAIVGLILVNSIADRETKRINAQANLAYSRGQAESMIVRAHGIASLDRAEAAAIRAEAFTAKMLSMLPYAVLAVLAVLGLAVVALAFVIVSKRAGPGWNQPQIIERQIVYLPPPNMARRDIWRLMSHTGSDAMIVPTNPENERVIR